MKVWKNLEEISSAVRQALRHISQGDLPPDNNPLLLSLSVELFLKRQRFRDTMATRQVAAVEVLKEAANRYAQREVFGTRDLQTHYQLSRFLFALLEGKQPEGIAPRTYDRYHREAMRILTEAVTEQEVIEPEIEEISLEAVDLLSAQDISEGRRRKSGLLELEMLFDAADALVVYNYCTSAEFYLRHILGTLAPVPDNLPKLDLKARTVAHLGHSAMIRGELAGPRGAISLFKEAQRLARYLYETTHDRRHADLFLRCTHGMGISYQNLGQWELADRYHEEVLNKAGLGTQPTILRAHVMRAQVGAVAELGQYSDAVDIGRQALEIAERVDDVSRQVISLEALGRTLTLEAAMGAPKWREARKFLQEAIRLSAKDDSSLDRAITLVTMTEHFVLQKDRQGAEVYREEAEALCRRHDFAHQLDRLNSLTKPGEEE